MQDYSKKTTPRDAADIQGSLKRSFPSQPHYTPTPRRSQYPLHGKVEGGVWRKRLCASKHFLRKPPAIAVDVQDLERAEACGAELLSVVDVETGRTYLAALSVIRKHGLELDRGFGLQVALPLHRWHCFGADTQAVVQLKLGLEG